ncbi:MAG: response regulator [Microcystaceae cyanobacterium]
MLNSTPSKSILVVEDSDYYKLLIKEAFNLLDISHKFTLVSTAEEALIWLEPRNNFPPDLIFLDLHLPQMSGHDLLKILKSDPKIQCVPVLVFSNYTKPKEILKSYQLQANCHLKKPTNIDELLYCLQTVFNFWFSVATLPPTTVSSEVLTPFI